MGEKNKKESDFFNSKEVFIKILSFPEKMSQDITINYVTWE